MRFAYGPDRARFKREDISATDSAGGTTTTHYVGGKAFERITAPGGAQTDKHYIGGFAVVTHAGVGDSAVATTQYLHRDHLGSLEATSDVAGALDERLSFDSWGRRRQGNWQPMTDAAIYNFDTQLTTRGYTGHEMLDGVGLVHMNGRVYDPTIGRFLSADPHVQAPGNLQNWNRYSYVMNNPLSYTDPTGFFFKKLLRLIGRAIGRIFKAIGAALKKVLRNPIVRAVIQLAGCITGNPFLCAATAAAVAAGAGGSLRDALKAAAFAFAQVQIFTIVGTITRTASAFVQTAVHGVVSGAISVARGGNFLIGFAGGVLGKIGSIVTRGINNAALRFAVSAGFGCAGTALSGGKCINGAVTAAFAHIYNELQGRALQCAMLAGAACMASGAAVASTVSPVCVTGIGCLAAPAAGALAAPELLRPPVWHRSCQSMLSTGSPQTVVIQVPLIRLFGYLPIAYSHVSTASSLTLMIAAERTKSGRRQTGRSRS